MRHVAWFLIVVLIFTSIAGCHSMHPVDLNDTAAMLKRVQPGDRVQFTTKGGTWQRVDVTYNDGKTLRGKVAKGEGDGTEQEYALTDVTNMEVRGISEEKAGIVTLITVVSVVVLAVGVVHAFKSLLGL